jgi:arsenate reductase
MTGAERPLRVLFICTGNSARSQMAEALLTRKGAGRFRVASAGSHPALQVNPLAVRVLAEQGIEWSGRMPRGMDGLDRERWDIVITVCDKAKEACPILPGQPVLAHWGMSDPAEVEGPEQGKLEAFRETRRLLDRRLDLLIALPVDTLERLALAHRVGAIGAEQ